MSAVLLPLWTQQNELVKIHGKAIEARGEVKQKLNREKCVKKNRVLRRVQAKRRKVKQHHSQDFDS